MGLRCSAAALAASALLAGAAPGQPRRTYPAMTQLTEVDHGRAISVRVGEAIDLALPENATTGYRWIAGAQDGGPVSVEPGAADYPSAAVGSGGTAHFRIVAGKAGVHSVTLRYARSWETDSPSDRRFSVTLDARP